MDEWRIVGVLVTLAGLFGAVGAPMLRLNSTITKLQTVLDDLRQDVDSMESRFRDRHRRLWEHNQRQDQTLCDHEGRIAGLERGGKERHER